MIPPPTRTARRAPAEQADRDDERDGQSSSLAPTASEQEREPEARLVNGDSLLQGRAGTTPTPPDADKRGRAGSDLAVQRIGGAPASARQDRGE